jgi:hypothetical protein
VGKPWLIAVEGVKGVGEYIFLHHHSEQTQDQNQLVFQEATKNNGMYKHIYSRDHFQKINSSCIQDRIKEKGNISKKFYYYYKYSETFESIIRRMNIH